MRSERWGLMPRVLASREAVLRERGAIGALRRCCWAPCHGKVPFFVLLSPPAVLHAWSEVPVRIGARATPRPVPGALRALGAHAGTTRREATGCVLMAQKSPACPSGALGCTLREPVPHGRRHFTQAMPSSKSGTRMLAPLALPVKAYRSEMMKGLTTSRRSSIGSRALKAVSGMDTRHQRPSLQ